MQSQKKQRTEKQKEQERIEKQTIQGINFLINGNNVSESERY